MTANATRAKGASSRSLELLRRLVLRTAQSALVVVGVVTLSFLLARQLPGNPVTMIVGPQASKEAVAHAQKVHALNQDPGSQYRAFWRQLVHAATHAGVDHRNCSPITSSIHVNLGYSYRYRQPVTKLLATRAPRSLKLAATAIFFHLVFGVGLGLLAAIKRRTWVDRSVTSATIAMMSVPSFIVGLALQYLFAYRLGWLPPDGFGHTPAEQSASVILPGLTLGIMGAALYARLVRDRLGREMDQPYVTAARARGGAIGHQLKHALRNALVPILTLMALEFGALIGGAVVTEHVFRWPGLGSTMVDAIVHRDAPVLLGTVLLAALGVVGVSTGIDLLATVFGMPKGEET